MGRTSFAQTSFRYGEWSQTSQGNHDTDEYFGAMNRCLNYYPLDDGPCTRRSGTRFSATVDALQGGTTAAVKLVPYITDEGASVLVVLLPGVIQFFQTGVLYGTVADTQVVDTVSNDDPAVVTTASAHGYSTNDIVRFIFNTEDGAAGAVSLVNGLYVITVIDSTSFSIAHTGARSGSVDGSGICWLGGDVTRVHTLAAPWGVTDVENVKYTQDANFLYLFHGSYATRLIDEDLAISTITLEDGPYLDLNLTATTLTPSGTTGSITVTASAIAGINGGTGFQTTDVGRQIRMLDSAGNWTWLLITARASTTSITATISGADLASTAAVTDWRLGLYSDTTGWPTHGVRHEGRLWLVSDAETGRVDGSEIIENQLTKDIFSFAPTSVDGTTSDGTAVAAIFDSEHRNRIQWLAADDSGLLGGAEEGVWTIQASSFDDPITSTSIQARRKTRYGCSDTMAVSVNRSTVFVEALERTLVEMRRYESGYDGKNASRTGDHLITDGLAEIRYANSPVPVVWGRTNTNRLVGVSFRRDIDGEQTGWHDQDLTYWLDPSQTAPEGKVLAICTLPKSDSTESLEDTLWVCVERNGFYCIEWMSHLFDSSRIEAEGLFADSAVTYASEDLSQTWNWTDPVNNILTFYGLWHLEGNTVDVVYRGVDFGTAVVASGKVALTVPDEIMQCASPLYADPERKIKRVKTSEYVFDSGYISDTTVAQIGGSSGSPTWGGQYFLEGEDGVKYYAIRDSGGVTHSNVHFIDKDIGGLPDITLTNTQFMIDMKNAGLDPLGLHSTSGNATVGGNIVIRGTPYFVYLAPSITVNGGFFFFGYYKVNSSGALELVGAKRERYDSSLLKVPDASDIQCVGLFGEQNLDDKILIIYPDGTNTNSWVMWLPSVQEMIGVFEAGSETGDVFQNRPVELSAWGQWFFNPDLSDVVPGIGNNLGRATLLPTIEGGQWKDWILSYVPARATQFSGTPVRANTYIDDLKSLYPNGFFTATKIKFNTFTESLEVEETVIFNCRFRSSDGSAAAPFSDVGLNKDGSTGVVLDDYQTPEVYPTDPDDALAPWIALVPHIFVEEVPDLDPIGSYLGIRAFDWSPASGLFNEQGAKEGATFDPVADLGVGRYDHDPVVVYPYWKDGDIDVFYNFGTFSPFTGLLVADFGTWAPTTIEMEYRTRGFEAYIGLNYVSRGQILRPQDGGTNGPMLGKTRRIDQFAVHAYRTGVVKFGINFEDMRLHFLKKPGDPETDSCGRRPLFSGIYEASLLSGYNFDNMVAWEQDRPAPGTFVQVGGFMTTSDR